MFVKLDASPGSSTIGNFLAPCGRYGYLTSEQIGGSCIYWGLASTKRVMNPLLLVFLHLSVIYQAVGHFSVMTLCGLSPLNEVSQP